MNIHEYQAKSLLKKFGVAVPNGGVAYTPAEAVEVANLLPGPVWVVKSQIHAGGRGSGRFKGGDPDKGGFHCKINTHYKTYGYYFFVKIQKN